MDKELLKKIFLEYMFEQTKKDERISPETLKEMADGAKLADEIVKDLENEELIELSGLIMNKFNPEEHFKNFKNIELTEKGIKYVGQNYGTDTQTVRDKFTEVANELPNVVNTILNAALNQPYEEIKNISVGHQSKRPSLEPKSEILVKNTALKKEAEKELKILYKALSAEAKSYDESIQILKEKLPEVSSVPTRVLLKHIIESSLIISGFLDTTKIDDAGFLKELLGRYKEINALLGSMAISEINRNELRKIYSELSNLNSFLAKYHTTNKKTIKEDTPKLSKNDGFTFEGVLGQNCGNYITITEENDDKRLPERIRNPQTGKRFLVDENISVLRGFAKASDLFDASEKDDNYQREPQESDLDNIKTFLTNIKDQAKYFPELTFVIRGGYELHRPELSQKLSGTPKGEFDNLEYYKISFEGKKLFRLDGNHRLNALNALTIEKNKDHYVPFAIILWGNRVPFKNEKGEIIGDDFDFQGYYRHLSSEEEQKYIDNEAFLFYFLNNKAKKLTTEENLKGLVNSKTWSEEELIIVNKNIVLLKYLQEQIDTSAFLSSYLCNNEPLKQISEVLEKINDDIDMDTFKSTMNLTNELLILDQWQELKRFNFYCQLLFYIAYIDRTKEKTLISLSQINRWIKKYNFGNETFDNPISLYKNAEKTNYLNSIKIFIAMPYYGDDEIDDFNDQFEKLRDEIIKKQPILNDRLVIFEIMRHRGFAIDIQEQIVKQIAESNIFIADISEHTIKKVRKSITSHANPNVMYELGLAKNQKHTEIILLKNETDKTDVPSDLITKYHNKFDMSNKSKIRKKLIEAIEDILKNKFGVI